MDITPYHWIFAAIFMVVFIGILIWTFNKDKKVNRRQFGNVTWISFLIGGGVILLIIIKFALRNLSQ